MAQVKRLPAVWETRFQSLGQEDLLKKKMAAHSNIPACRIPWTEEPGRLQSNGSQRVGHNWATSLSSPQKFSEKNVFYMFVPGRCKVYFSFRSLLTLIILSDHEVGERGGVVSSLPPWCQGWGHPESWSDFPRKPSCGGSMGARTGSSLCLMLWAGPPIPNIPSVSIMMVVIKSWPLPSHALHL